MTTAVRHPTPQMSEMLRETILNNAAIAGLMVATAGVLNLVARNAMDHIDPRIAVAIVVIPYIGSKVIQHFVPRTNDVAISLGAAYGIAIPCAFGSSTSTYAVGSVAAALSAGLVTAHFCLMLTREENLDHSAANRTPV